MNLVVFLKTHRLAFTAVCGTEFPCLAMQCRIVKMLGFFFQAYHLLLSYLPEETTHCCSHSSSACCSRFTQASIVLPPLSAASRSFELCISVRSNPLPVKLLYWGWKRKSLAAIMKHFSNTVQVSLKKS